jgi:hypothetical protein
VLCSGVQPVSTPPPGTVVYGRNAANGVRSDALIGNV